MLLTKFVIFKDSCKDWSEDQYRGISEEVPMRLADQLELAAELTPEGFDDFRRHLNGAWIDEALCATGVATLRRRRLPTEQVIWLVIGMALMRNRPIEDVVDKLDLALPGPGPVAKSSIAEARSRVGGEPMEWLFFRSADAWGQASAQRHQWRGLGLYGVDGSTLRVPDSDENREHFGGSSAGSGGRGPSGYPLVRLAALMALRSHVLVAASFGAYANSESHYAADLWRFVPDNSLVIVDKLYFAAGTLIPLVRDGKERHWLTPAKSNAKHRTVKKLGPGDELVEFNVSSVAARKDPSLPKTWQVRAIRYQRRGFRPRTLLTSMLDPTEFPAADVRVLYHERWEIELGYGEIKTEMLEREEAIRSRKPDGVRQELWGVLLAYNLVRLEMERIADEAGLDPSRISFAAALRFIRDEWFWSYGTRSPGAIPAHLRAMRENIKRFILPPRRSERRYKRVVKIKMSSYPLNRRRRSAQ
jgi:hypothetical protein